MTDQFYVLRESLYSGENGLAGRQKWNRVSTALIQVRAWTKVVNGDGETKESLRTLGDIKLMRLGVYQIGWCGSGHGVQESTRLLVRLDVWKDFWNLEIIK